MPGHRLRLLLALSPVYVLLLMLLGTAATTIIVDPLHPIASAREMLDVAFWRSGSWWAWCGVPAVVLAVTQAAIIAPMAVPSLARTPRGRSVLLGLVVAAGIAACLTVALMLALLELIRAIPGGIEEVWLWPVALVVLIAGWATWTVVFVVFTRRRPGKSPLERIVVWLLAGTVIETLAIVPIDIMVRRRTDCYCATGTFYALLISAWAAMWLAGPGAIVLYLRRRRRRARTNCVACGYAKGPSPAGRCPECGAPWDPDSRA